MSKLARDHSIRAVVALVLGCALIGTFTLYARPGFLVLLANQVWACF